MNAHDVRRLRHCVKCDGLDYRETFLSDESMCIECAYHNAGSLKVFMQTYDRVEWSKLPLNLIGVDNMRTLLTVMEE